MGGACCVAARDKNIVHGPSSDILHRNVRNSPTWSFRWENRGRVAGENASVSWLSDGVSRNDGSEIKYESTHPSENGSPLESFHGRTWHTPPLPEGTALHIKTPAADQSISRNFSTDTSLEQVRDPTQPLASSTPSPSKISVSLPSSSSLSASPLSFQSHMHPASSGMRRWSHHSPGRPVSGQTSYTRPRELKSSISLPVVEDRSTFPSWSNESTRESLGGSSHGVPNFFTSPHGERWSFDNEMWSFNGEKTRSSSRLSTSSAGDLQTCGVCLKLLTEKSLWSAQKLIPSNELSVVAVLICGHVYHAECLETMTPEISKYDPACPLCTLGEKQTYKLSQKAWKAEMDLKAKNKKLRNRVVDSDLGVESVSFDRLKGGRDEVKGPKLGSSSSMKSSTARPFLKRHFSFGSKGSRYISENQSNKKKGFFWTKSMKD